MGFDLFGVNTPVAGAISIPENRNLSFKTENGSENDRLAQFDGSVVDQILGGKIVGAIDNDVVFSEDFQCIVGGQPRAVGDQAGLVI